ncbi:MAG: PIN domain-containing protein [Solirubrobacterales bacterium]
MNRTDTYLVDASVWVAIADPSERYHETARELVGEVGQPLAALDLTLYEVANAIGAKQGRPDEGRVLTRLILKRCRGVLPVDADLIDAALDIVAEHGLTAYDAAYVAAARRHGWTLVSADIADLVSKGLAVAPDAADYP